MSVSKIVAAAASGVGGAGLDVDEVFSTFLYDGTGSARNIVNDINMADNGGLVWIKSRTEGGSQYDGFHILCDSERGVNKTLNSDSSKQENWTSFGNTVTGFNNTNGFSIGDSDYVNYNGHAFASWTFRKAKKFFDVVTWSGNGVNGRTISHNLGSVPGMILVKRTDSADGWITYHRGMDASSPEDYAMFLNLNNARATETYWNNTAPTSTGFTVSSNVKLNGSSGTYVAYVFAHNNSDGEFGPDGDADIIKCGSYAASSQPNFINVGFEPQWLLIKNITTNVGDWYIYDSMRGVPTGSGDREIEANDSAAEAASSGGGQDWVDFNATGFTLKDNYEGVNQSGKTYIYMAIRRGPLAAPDDPTKVFNINANTVSGVEPVSGFVTDFAIANYASQSSPWYLTTRLQGNQFLSSNATDAEATINHTAWDRMDGAYNTNMTGYQIWHWKRAPSYFDCIAYLGSGTATQPHSLAASPEMIWIKQRDGTANWTVLTNFTSTQYDYLYLNKTDAATTVNYSANEYLSAAPTATGIPFVDYYGVNDSNPQQSYIAYLFATVAGVSKVGSYTGNGSTSGPTVDCGFSGSPRFVLIKRTANTGSYYVFDSVRGIVAGAESQLYLNSTAAEQTATDQIDPTSSGFQIVTNATGLNSNGETYIFYAIA